MWGLLGSGLARGAGWTWGLLKSVPGLVVATLGVGTAAEVATRKTDPKTGAVIKDGVVVSNLKDGVSTTAKTVADTIGGAAATMEDNTKAVDRKQEAAKTLFTAQGQAAGKDADAQAQEIMLEMQAQSDSLRGSISKANFWTGTFGSILVDLVNEFAPNSWLADKVNGYVDEAKALKDKIPGLIDKKHTVMLTGDNMPETAGVARTEYRSTDAKRGEAQPSMVPPKEEIKATTHELTAPAKAAEIKKENLSFRPELGVAPQPS